MGTYKISDPQWDFRNGCEVTISKVLTVAGLSVKCQEVFHLKHLGYTHKEIASILGKSSISTVDYHWKNAKEKLRWIQKLLINVQHKFPIYRGADKESRFAWDKNEPNESKGKEKQSR